MKLANTTIFKDSGYKLERISKSPCKRFDFGSDDYSKCIVVKYASFKSYFAGTYTVGSKDSEDVVQIFEMLLK